MLTIDTPEFQRDLLWWSPMNPVLIPLIDTSLRDAVTSLWQLDHAMIRILRTVKEPALRQIRLAWWRDSVLRLGNESAQNEPTLQALSQHVVSHITPLKLAELLDLWEDVMISEPDQTDVVERFAAVYGPAFWSVTAAITGYHDIQYGTAAARFIITRHAVICAQSGPVQSALFQIASATGGALSPRNPRFLRALDRLSLRVAGKQGHRNYGAEQLTLLRATIFG